MECSKCYFENKNPRSKHWKTLNTRLASCSCSEWLPARQSQNHPRDDPLTGQVAVTSHITPPLHADQWKWSMQSWICIDRPMSSWPRAYKQNSPLFFTVCLSINHFCFNKTGAGHERINNSERKCIDMLFKFVMHKFPQNTCNSTIPFARNLRENRSCSIPCF